VTGEPTDASARTGEARLLEWLAARRDADDAAAATTEVEVVEWATDALRRVCPIVTGLLAFDGRLAAEVTAQLRRGEHPGSISEWGLGFASRLESDADPWISWAAQVDAGTLVVERSRGRAGAGSDAKCPGDPIRAVLLINAGTDPRSE